jgi:hypothetical protein
VERWILAALRKRKFFTLAELNQAIAELLTRLNERPFRKRDGCRRHLYEKLSGSSMPRRPLLARSRSSIMLAGILTASPSRTIACWISNPVKSASSGKTIETRVSGKRWRFLLKNLSGGFSSTLYPMGSSAFDITAYSAIATGNKNWPGVENYWAWHLQ